MDFQKIRYKIAGDRSDCICRCVVWALFDCRCGGRKFFYDTRFDAYWEANSASAVQGFQEYVTKNGLSIREALTDTKWNKENSDIILFTEPAFLYEEMQSALDKEDEYERINCSDGFIYATSYSPGDPYFF